MHPILFHVGSTPIYSYGFLIAVGYVSALLLGRHLAKARGLDPSPLMDLAFLAIVSGVVGARLFFVLQSLDRFASHPAEIFDVWSGGLVFYGGFLLATASCMAFGFWKKLPIWLTTDIAAAGVAIGHAFGRLGCFAAGCCYGSYCPFPWGVENQSNFVDAEHRGIPLHPVQLYESFLLFSLAAALAWLIRSRKLPDGIPAAIYLAAYALIRFLTEMFRGDADRGFVLGGWLSVSQAVALGLFALGSGVLVRRLGRKNL